MARRFPAPWTVETLDGGFKVVDANGQALVRLECEVRLHNRSKGVFIGSDGGTKQNEFTAGVALRQRRIGSSPHHAPRA